MNLQYNKGFKWNKFKDIYCKGCVFDEEDNLYQGQDLSQYFNCMSEDGFIGKVMSANGSFAVIVQRQNKLFISVDRLRSIPLFYALKNNNFYLSDNAYWIKNELNLKNLRTFSEQEFSLTGYVTGTDTLFNEIKQIQAGEYLVVEYKNGRINIKARRYYQYLHYNFFTEPREELFDKLDKVSENIFKRLIKSVNGKTIVVPLSGGYDSRCIAAMLKKLNYENVICFSYGKKDNWEPEISRNVADKLDYKWYFVEYTREKWFKWFNSKERKEYYRYGDNLCSLAHIQDLPAVKELKETKKISNDAVFVPGHSGDFIAGSHIPVIFASLKKVGREKLVKSIWKKHYLLRNWCKEYKKLAPLFEKKILSLLTGFSMDSPEKAVDAFEAWDWQSRQAKFIVNSVRVYEFFGYEWRVPLWDNELMDFWARVPLKFRINKELYDDYLFKRLFKTYDIGFKERGKSKNLIRSVAEKALPEFVKNMIMNMRYKKDSLNIVPAILKFNATNSVFMPRVKNSINLQISINIDNIKGIKSDVINRI